MQDQLAALIRREHARSYVAFSEWIALGFPVVNDTNVIWGSRFDSMWPLHEMIDGQPRPTDAKRAAWPVADWVVEDFLRACPDIAVVDRRGSADYVALLSHSHPSFARAWQLYHPIAAFNGIVAFGNRASPRDRQAFGCGAGQGTPVASR